MLVLVGIDAFCISFVQIPLPAYCCEAECLPQTMSDICYLCWIVFLCVNLKIVCIKLFFIYLKLPGHLTVLLGNARSNKCF